MDPAFLERLRIRETAERYFFCADTHDAAGVARCFARDAVFRSVTQTEMFMRGRADIETAFQAFAKRGRTSHLISSMQIELDGEAATSRLLGVSYGAGAARPGDPIQVRGISYTDRWVVEDGAWVIAERVHEALWQFASVQIDTQLPTVAS
jgi:ketosteroid isomerase-like protein